jgi:carbon-monoxide dehydrogenase medium subunit
MDIAVAGAGSWIKLSADGKQVEQARIGLAAIAPTPKLAVDAGLWLVGQPATEESFAKAGELAKKVASPITDMRGTAEYRTHLVGVLVKRTLAKAADRARA